jgi:hypothetical protein
MRKPFALSLFIALLLNLAACGTPAAPELETLTLPLAERAWFTEEQPEARGSELVPDTLRVGRTYDGKDIFALVKAQLDGEIKAGQVLEAWLCLKIAENNGGSSIQIGAPAGPWEADIVCEDARALVGDLRTARQALATDGWLQIDITQQVKGWLAGEENFGIALFEGNPSTETVFAAGDGEGAPRLEIIIEKR